MIIHAEGPTARAPRWHARQLATSPGVLGALLLASLLLVPCPAARARDILPLDGPWSFRLDPEAQGEQDHWADRQVAFTDTIRVPGAWDAQGFGPETDKLHHNFVGQAWYKRTVTLPADWSGRRIFLCVGGVHRYADVWVNGARLGEHIGYLSPFEFEITPHAQPGTEAVITLRVDSKQRWEVDCLAGCFDMIDEMFTSWGGVWGHVWLESRGQAWIEDLQVESQLPSARCTVHAQVAGETSAFDEVVLKVAPVGAGTGTEMAQRRGTSPALTASVEMPGARLWSPDAPNLYTAELILRKGDQVVDRVSARFGFRDIRTIADHFLLNGKPLFLRGYGDDAIYPETMAAPSDREFYLRRLRTIKTYGFNFVRHHSHILPPEYYEAADEVGMLVSAEFPIAYEEYSRRARDAALGLYASEWKAAIQRLRNHPSIFDWSMANEHWASMPFAADLYRIAKSLDPGRLVIDSDGLWPAGFLNGTRDRPTLDFYAVQFDAHVLPLDRPAMHRVEGKPRKPVVCHETGNYVTFPRLSEIGVFRDNIKPFWLTPVKEKLTKRGLLDEAEQWSRNSEELYLLCHKLNVEDLRKQASVSGYTWWLFQDYWTGSNGIVDHYFRPKSIDAARVRAFNDDLVLLLDGLDVTVRSGEVKPVLRVSNYSNQAITRGSLEWSFGESKGTIDLAQFPCDIGRISSIPIGVVGALSTSTKPERVLFRAKLTSGDKSCANEWSTWVYPVAPPPPRISVPLLASPEVADELSRYRPEVLSGHKPIPERAILVTALPTRRMLEAVAAGASLVLLDPDALFPTVPNRFKTCWWLGNTTDSNVGTVVYDRCPLKAIAPQGWCDSGWYHLLEGSRAAVLDDLPGTPEVYVRAIDVHSQCRSKAVVLACRVGQGSLIVCGLKLTMSEGLKRPEQQWVLDQLIDHAGSAPKPSEALPLEWLRARIDERGIPDEVTVPGFANLVSNEGEQADYANYRGIQTRMYVCRQTARGHRIEWNTATLPKEGIEGASVTFAFSGGLGWRNQPKSAGFELHVNGQPVVTFDIASEHHTWKGDKAGIQLVFVPRRSDAEDSMGLFYLTLPGEMATPGRPCRLAITSRSQDSRRWFGLTP